MSAAPDGRSDACRVVTTSLSAELLLLEQLRHLDEFAWTIVAGDTWAGAPEWVETRLIGMSREPGPSDLRSFFELLRFFGARRFAFVQTHTPKASMVALPAARLRGQRTIYTVHGSLYFRGNRRLRNVLGWVFERWCCAWAHEVFLQSAEDLEVLPAVHICKREKLHLIGNGIDLDRFAPVPAPRRASMPTVLMVSRLVVEKGCADFFQVARRLRKEARFVHVGPIEVDQRDAISATERHRAESYGVEFVGAVPDVAPHLADADIVVLPSYREGIPRAAMEACATGRPLIAYDIRGVREVVPSGFGLLVPLGDEDALEEAIARLVSDSAARERAGSACMQHVRSAFGEDLVIERLRAGYAKVGR